MPGAGANPLEGAGSKTRRATETYARHRTGKPDVEETRPPSGTGSPGCLWNGVVVRAVGSWEAAGVVESVSPPGGHPGSNGLGTVRRRWV
jgi:hypothetical protein